MKHLGDDQWYQPSPRIVLWTVYEENPCGLTNLPLPSKFDSLFVRFNIYILPVNLKGIFSQAETETSSQITDSPNGEDHKQQNQKYREVTKIESIVKSKRQPVLFLAVWLRRFNFKFAEEWNVIIVRWTECLIFDLSANGQRRLTTQCWRFRCLDRQRLSSSVYWDHFGRRCMRLCSKLLIHSKT